jgi:AbrB family looped-hinge helix DNA binding protein
MSEKGQITVPRAARQRRGLQNGSALEFIDDAGGDLIFRPIQASPKLDLVDHLDRLRGVEIPERQHLCPPRT